MCIASIQLALCTAPNAALCSVCASPWYRYLSVALWLVLVLSYLATNLAFSLCISLRAKNSTDDITLSRVLVSEVLFLTLALLLGIFVVIVYTTSVGRSVLEAQVCADEWCLCCVTCWYQAFDTDGQQAMEYVFPDHPIKACVQSNDATVLCICVREV